jgi:hypothetical protein
MSKYTNHPACKCIEEIKRQNKPNENENCNWVCTLLLIYNGILGLKFGKIAKLFRSYSYVLFCRIELIG